MRTTEITDAEAIQIDVLVENAMRQCRNKALFKTERDLGVLRGEINSKQKNEQ